MTFAHRAKEVMKQKGISQNELARKAGLSSSGISTTLSEGGNPRESSMISIINALGLSPEEFWTFNHSEYSKPSSGVTLTHRQEILLEMFNQLNDEGKNHLLKLAEVTLSESHYRQESSIPFAG